MSTRMVSSTAIPSSTITGAPSVAAVASPSPGSRPQASSAATAVHTGRSQAARHQARPMITAEHAMIGTASGTKSGADAGASGRPVVASIATTAAPDARAATISRRLRSDTPGATARTATRWAPSTSTPTAASGAQTTPTPPAASAAVLPYRAEDTASSAAALSQATATVPALIPA